MSLPDRAIDVANDLSALGCEVFEVEGARFVRDRSAPNVWDSNFVSQIRARTPEEIERLLARAEREFAGSERISFRCDHRTPPEFEAALAMRGCERSEILAMLAEGELQGEPKPVEIRLVEGDEGWRLYEDLHRADFAEYSEDLGSPDDSLIGEMIRARRSSSPPARFWLAYADGAPRAYMTSWEGTDGVGQVEDLFTYPDYRNRGLARALVHHCVADARAHGAGPVVIMAEPADTPKRMYAAMGFRPLALTRTWRMTRASG